LANITGKLKKLPRSQILVN